MKKAKEKKENAPLELLLTTIAQERKLDLRAYKRGTLERRIQRRMDKMHVKTYPEYLDLLRKRPGEVNELLESVLINVTRFFRDPAAWKFLGAEALPKIMAQAREAGGLRVWCAGCSSGEEVYSVAILIAEQLSKSKLKLDVKIYATDADEGALKFAREGLYSEESLEFVPSELRAKYFGGERGRRIAPELRRMVIFGRSNLLTSPPLSHMHFVLCRNLLIYFDQIAQQVILAKLTRALEEGGVLFLGRAESQSSELPGLRVLSTKWRIFQMASSQEPSRRADRPNGDVQEKAADVHGKAANELRLLKAYQQSILETLEPGILILDSLDTVITENEPARRFWRSQERMVGKPLHETEIWRGCPELEGRIKESRATHPETVRFECKSPSDNSLALTIRPILSKGEKGQVGTLLYMEDIGPKNSLQSTVEQLEHTTEELQSSNEELESTNEELQSTNEELETLNEELQSSNEELETTNEELQSLNEELETTNSELQERGLQLDELNQRYGAMVQRMPLPVLLVDSKRTIHLFNSAAQKLLGFANPSKEGMRLDQLPLPLAMCRLLAEKHANVARKGEPEILRNTVLQTTDNPTRVNIHLSPLLAESPDQGILIVFEPFHEQSASSDGVERVRQSAGSNAHLSKGNSKPAKALRK